MALRGPPGSPKGPTTDFEPPQVGTKPPGKPGTTYIQGFSGTCACAATAKAQRSLSTRDQLAGSRFRCPSDIHVDRSPPGRAAIELLASQLSWLARGDGDDRTFARIILTGVLPTEKVRPSTLRRFGCSQGDSLLSCPGQLGSESNLPNHSRTVFGPVQDHLVGTAVAPTISWTV